MTYDPQSYGLVNLGGAGKEPAAEARAQHAEDILFAQDPGFAPDPDLPPVNQFGGSEPVATGNLGALLEGLPELDVAPAAVPAKPTAKPKPSAASQKRGAPPRRQEPVPAQPQAAGASAEARRQDRFGQRPESAAPRLMRRQRGPIWIAPLLVLAGFGVGAWFWYGLHSLPFAILAPLTGLVAGMLSWAMLRR